MKRAVLYIFLIVLITMSSAVQYCYAANLLTNPGFEQGDFPPHGWNDWSGSESENPNDGVAGFPAPKESSHSGNKCAGKIFYGTGERWGGFSQTLDIAGSGTFNASVWLMNNKNDVALGKGAKAYMEVKFLDESENELKKATSNSVRGPSDWTKLTLAGHVPSSCKKAVFSLVLLGSKSSRGKVFFDDASLQITK